MTHTEPEHATEFVATSEEVFALLDAMNQSGTLPEVIAYDAYSRPLMLWLNESGGDDVTPEGVILMGQSSDRSEPVPVGWDDLSYPVRVVRP